MSSVSNLSGVKIPKLSLDNITEAERAMDVILDRIRENEQDDVNTASRKLRNMRRTINCFNRICVFKENNAAPETSEKQSSSERVVSENATKDSLLLQEKIETHLPK